MRFIIGGKTYEASSVDRISLANILRLEKETAELGRPLKWSQFKALVDNTSNLSEAELESHDDTPWVIALTIWASRLNAGEHVTFAEAIDFPLGDLQWVPEPQDHKPGKAQSSRKGSAGAGAHRAAKAAAKMSAPQSSPA